jgi:hypothetical protein
LRLCRDIQAKIDAEERAKAEVKAKAKAMATALKTIGVIKIPKKARQSSPTLLPFLHGHAQPQLASPPLAKHTFRPAFSATLPPSSLCLLVLSRKRA